MNDSQVDVREYRHYDDADNSRGFRGTVGGGGHALVSSTTRIDLHGTVLLSEGADITRMASHPSIFLNHNYSTGWFGGGDEMDTLAIGVHLPDSPRRTKTEISSRMAFDTDSPDDDRALRARVIEDQVVKRMLTGVSISFRARAGSEWVEMRVDDLCKETGLTAADFGLEDVDEDQRVPVMPDWHLIESSVVTVPSNPGGIVRSAGVRNHLAKAWERFGHGDADGATREFDEVRQCIEQDDGRQIARAAHIPARQEGHQTSTSLSAPPGGWDEAGFRDRIEPVLVEMLDRKLGEALSKFGLRAEEVVEPVAHAIPPTRESHVEEVLNGLAGAFSQ